MKGFLRHTSFLRTAGLKLISKGLLFGKGLLDLILNAPPNIEDITRRFISRVGSILIDMIAGRNAQLLLPVSEFAVDGSVDAGLLDITSDFTIGHYFSPRIESTMTLFSNSSTGLVSGLDVNIRVSNPSAGLEVGFRGVLVTQIPANILIDKNYSIIITKQGLNIEVWLNEVLISAFTLPSNALDSAAPMVLGSRLSSFFFNGSMWDVELPNLSIPLPHLAHGFDANGDNVDLTVTGGVTGGFSKFGTLALINDGFVSRTEYQNLVLNSEAFENPTWIKSAGTIVTANQIIAPDGTLTADLINASATDARVFYGIQGSPSYAASTKYSGALWLRSVSGIGTWNISLLASNGDGQVDKFVNLTEEWQRFSIENVESSIGADVFNIYPVDTRRGGQTLTQAYAWGASMNKGSSIIQYQKTEAAEISETTTTIIPNNSQGGAIMPLVAGDTYYAGSTFLNPSPWKLRLFTLGDTDVEYTFFNRSNALNWKSNTQAEDGLFDSTEVMQKWIYDNQEDAFKYQWWSKDYKDLFLYSAPLTGPDICQAKNYVELGEEIPTPEALGVMCSIDIPI